MAFDVTQCSEKVSVKIVLCISTMSLMVHIQCAYLGGSTVWNKDECRSLTEEALGEYTYCVSHESKLFANEGRLVNQVEISLTSDWSS